MFCKSIKYMSMRVPLKYLNTFSIDVSAKCVITIHNEYMLLKIWSRYFNQGIPVLILGGGSNVLFLENYIGVVLLNRIKGIFITENEKVWRLHIGAGEKWSELVIFTINKNMPGLENLAFIPGYVGSASIQNIGAYGVELSQVCEYVDVLELKNGKKIRFYSSECEFQYRSSIFRKYFNEYAVVYVGLRLFKHWKPVLKHNEFSIFRSFQITYRQIFNLVYLMRKKKLPNPNRIGNAGSFFKNPVVSIKLMQNLFHKYPNIPYVYQTSDRIKLSAGWLIEYCSLKGCMFGEAAVYHKQALILINIRQMAVGTEIAALALYIYNKVFKEFNICLQPEVRLINSYGEINPKKLFI